MLRIGIAGVGFMGMVHYLSYQKLEGVRVDAISDRSEAKRAGDWRGIKGNFGPPGEQMDLAGVRTHATIDELIADPELDAVDLTLPPALHADVACRAFEAGKHVFCEKPMAMSVADCDRMRDAARAAGKRLLIGHVLPYFPEYAWALREARGGAHGALLGGSFKRVISDPAWLTTFWDADRVGGPMLDLHVHDAHFIRLLFGKPAGVTTHGRERNGLPEFWHTQFDYGQSDLTVEATSGVINQQGRPFQHAFEIHFERATLMFDFAVLGEEGKYLCPPTLLAHDGSVVRPELTGGDPMDAFRDELAEVVRSLTEDDDSLPLGADPARDAIELCGAQAASLRSAERVALP